MEEIESAKGVMLLKIWTDNSWRESTMKSLYSWLYCAKC